MAEPVPAPSAGQRPLTTFLDPDRQREYDTDGFTVVPWLSRAEVQMLLDGYAALVPEADEEHIAFDFTRDDRSIMEGTLRLLQPLFAAKVPEHFVDHEAVFWTFVIKPPGPHSEMALHDDRTYVDESRGRACTVWVPLVDTSPELDNGYLCVVAGSHTIMPVASGTNVPNWFEPYDQYLKDHSQRVAVPAGSALIYDSKTLHWSPPNRSDRTRPALAVAVVPSGEQLVHVVGEGMHHRRVYAVDRDFYVNHHPTAIEQGMPEGYPLLREYHEDRVSAAPEDVARAIGAEDVPVPTGSVVEPVPRVYRPGEDHDEGGEGDEGADALTVPESPTFPSGLRARLRGVLARW